MTRKPILYSKIVRSDETPKLVVFLIKNKIVRTETQAVYFLILVVAISTALAVYFFLSINGGLVKPAPFVGTLPPYQL